MNDNLLNRKIKELYKDVIPGRYQNNYEFNRWFNSALDRLDYFMMHSAIQHHLSNVTFESCLEFGPGPGTWTRLLYRQNPKAKLDLVDISEEMKGQFELEMRTKENVNYHLIDVMDFRPNAPYDFFFSSRAIEYLEDKKGFLEKLKNDFLRPGGQGVIVTKNPLFNPWRQKKDKRFQHQGQIAPMEMAKMLQEAGFMDIVIYPVIIRMVWDRFSLKFSEKKFCEIYDKPLNDKNLLITESYLIVFKNQL